MKPISRVLALLALATLIGYDDVAVTPNGHPGGIVGDLQGP